MKKPSAQNVKIAIAATLAGAGIGALLWYPYRAFDPRGSGDESPAASADADAVGGGPRDQAELDAQLPCHPAEPRGDFLARAKEWNSFLDGLRDPAQAVRALNGRLPGPGIPLRLGTPDPTNLEPEKAAYDRRFPNRLDEEESGGNPGTWLFLPGRIDASVRMGADDAPSGDLVVEMEGSAEAAREVRRWRVPLETAPDAVAGDELLEQSTLASLCRKDVRTWPTWLAFRPDGSFRAVPPPSGAPAEPQAAQAACPPVEEFVASEFVTCARFKDLKTGRSRLLVWQSPSS